MTVAEQALRHDGCMGIGKESIAIILVNAELESNLIVRVIFNGDDLAGLDAANTNGRSRVQILSIRDEHDHFKRFIPITRFAADAEQCPSSNAQTSDNHNAEDRRLPKGERA